MAKKIPFWMWPMSWGMSGKTRKVAELEYYHKGMQLEIELAKLNLGEDTKAYTVAKLDIDLKFNKIDQQTYDYEKISIEYPNKESKDYKVAKLDLDRKYKLIEEAVYQKDRSDLLEEPYVGIPNLKFDPQNPSGCYFELDYNKYFVKFLEENGYTGINDEAIVNRWFNDVCLSVVEELYQNNTEERPEIIVKKVKLEDGKTEHR